PPGPSARLQAPQPTLSPPRTFSLMLRSCSRPPANHTGDVLSLFERNGDAEAEGRRSIVDGRGRLVHDGRWGRDIDRPRRVVDHRRRGIIDIAWGVVSVALVVIIAAVPTVMVLPAICHGRAQRRGGANQRSDAYCRRQHSPAIEKSILG